MANKGPGLIGSLLQLHVWDTQFLNLRFNEDHGSDDDRDNDFSKLTSWVLIRSLDSDSDSDSDSDLLQDAILPIDWSIAAFLIEEVPLQNGGTCYAHATAGTLTSRLRITLQPFSISISSSILEASTQHIIDCCLNGAGTEGGSVVRCLKAILEHGIRLKLHYQTRNVSEGIRGPCMDCNKLLKGLPLITISSYKVIYHPTSEQIRVALLGGPIILDVFVGSPFYLYETLDENTILSEGVYPIGNGKEIVLHSIILMGEDECRSCWNVKNSWSPDWGYQGYARLDKNLTPKFYRIAYPKGVGMSTSA